MVEVVHQQSPVRQLGQRIVQGIELQPALQLLMLLELLLQSQVGLPQLLQALIDGVFRIDVVQLLPDPSQLQQQGQLAAQEVEEQPIVCLQRLRSADDEMGEILLLQPQGLAVPEQLLLVLLHVVGAVTHARDEFIAVQRQLGIDLFQLMAVDAHQQHVLDVQHLAQHGFQLGEQGLAGQGIGQANDAIDALDFFLPVRILADERRSQLRELRAGLGFIQSLGEAFQQQAQGWQLLGLAAGQQPLHLAMLDGKHAPALGFIKLGQLLGES